MGKLKTKKSIIKRVKITKTGKLFKRPGGQNHFNAKESGNQERKKSKVMPIKKSDYKMIKKFIPYN